MDDATTTSAQEQPSLSLVGKLDPETIDETHAAAWAEAIADDEAKLEAVLAEEEAVACDRAAAFA